MWERKNQHVKHSYEMVPLEEAFAAIDGALSGFAPEVETVRTAEAVGRVLLEDAIALQDLPPFDKSAVDGYAIPEGDESTEYRVIETVPAGSSGRESLRPGTAVKVMTGSQVPPGTGRVVMLEDAIEESGVVRLKVCDGPRNICPRGEDIKKGELLFEAGHLLEAVDVANLISAGRVRVSVARRPRVAIICTGNEIVDEPNLLGPGKIMNSNGPMLEALVEENNLDCVGSTIVPDEPSATAKALARALESADITLLSGGVSVGDFDYVPAAMEELGLKIHFRRVAIKPGKPTTFATAFRKAVFGLPGNPVSAFLTFHLFALRAASWMRKMKPQLRYIQLPMAADFKRKKSDRTEFVPCRLTDDGRLEPVEFHGSAHLMALSKADGFLVVLAGTTHLEAGRPAKFLPKRGRWV